MANFWENDPVYKPNAPKQASANFWENDPVAQAPKTQQSAPAPGQPSMLQNIGQGAGNLAAGLIRGAGSIGATILAPYDMAKDALDGKGLSLESNRARRQGIDDGLQTLGAQPNSTLYQGGKIAGEIAGTAGAGGVLGNAVARVAPGATNIANALATNGFRAGETTGVRNALTRAIGGSVAGGATAGLIDPNDAASGAVIGGALPVAFRGAGAVGGIIGKGISGAGKLVGGEVSPEVSALAKRANELGIDIPADRITNSRPLNALASSLNYVPFSGRAAVEKNMENQLTKAATRTFGQESDNMGQALRTASKDLGGKFDDVLKNNQVKVTDSFLSQLGEIGATAERELGKDGLQAISGQINEILQKGQSGVIDGQAAYNIKKALDRIGRRNTPEAYHATEMKKALMGALNESIGPEAAAAFAKTRQQYGNMLSLEKLAQNGAEGDISIARMANMRNINNEPLQEIADIAAQFVKSREGAHGAAQRAITGGIAAYLGGPASLAAGAASGRATNALLNSNAGRKLFAGQSYAKQTGRLGSGFNALVDLAEPNVYRAAPQLSNDR
jgi:hypothetical protein